MINLKIYRYFLFCFLGWIAFFAIVDVPCYVSTVSTICDAGEHGEVAADSKENQNSMETETAQEIAPLRWYWCGFTVIFFITLLFCTGIFFYGLKYWLKE